MSANRLRVATVITRMAAGAGGVALRGAIALDPDRYDITVITGGTGVTGERLETTADVISGVEAVKSALAGDLLGDAYAAGLRVIRIPSLVPEISLGKDRTALRILTELFETGGYDVVHTHSAKAGALGRLAASRAGVGRIVHTLHGFPFHEFQSPLRRNAYVGIERWLGRRTHVFLAVGSAVAAEAIRRGLAPPDRVRTIPPATEGLVRPTGTAARGLARRRLGLPAGVRLVGTVGRVDYQKAPELWIEALSMIPGDDVWGVWIGDGPMRETLLDKARRFGVADRFTLLGHRDDAVELLPALDVFALASRYEGLPCALIEAVEAGVPIVATAVNALPDIVVPGETGLLVSPQDPRSLARAIRYMLDDPAEGARMAAAARVRVGDHYTPQALGLVLDHTYRRRTQWN
jgi:glycosyltransferase involved in cell wall biosynthesis